MRADKKSLSAPNVSAAWVFWDGVRDLRTPSQVKETRTAAELTRRRWAGVVADGESVGASVVAVMIYLR